MEQIREEVKEIKLTQVLQESRIVSVEGYIKDDVKPMVEDMISLTSKVDLIGLIVKIVLPSILLLFIWIVVSIHNRETENMLITRDLESLTKDISRVAKDVEKGNRQMYYIKNDVLKAVNGEVK